MGLNEAGKLGTTQDIFSSMQLFGIIFQFVLPLVAVLVGIEVVKMFKKAFRRKLQRDEIARQQDKEKQKQQKQITNAQKEKQRKINRLFKDDEFLMKQLDGTHEPFDKSAYHDLDLTFDRNGKVIR